MKNIYTTYDVSKLLSVDITTVMKWVDENKIIAYKTPGGHRRIFHQDLLNFLKSFNIPIPDQLSKNGKTILIVDDDPQIIKALQKFIKKINPAIQVEVAEDGFDAGSKIQSMALDLVILDLNLPGVDGFKVCKIIRASKTNNKIKILAISGDTSEKTKEKILACGADEFLEKPIDGEILTRLLSHLLKLNLGVRK